MFNANKNKLNIKIAKVQFVIHDLSLYLDTHPNDAQAVKHYEFYQNKLAALENEHDKLYGSKKSIRDGSWTWIEGPWPWEREFNQE